MKFVILKIYWNPIVCCPENDSDKLSYYILGEYKNNEESENSKLPNVKNNKTKQVRYHIWNQLLLYLLILY